MSAISHITGCWQPKSRLLSIQRGPVYATVSVLYRFAINKFSVSCASQDTVNVHVESKKYATVESVRVKGFWKSVSNDEIYDKNLEA